MKITKTQLKEIIKEELQAVLNQDMSTSLLRENVEKTAAQAEDIIEDPEAQAKLAAALEDPKIKKLAAAVAQHVDDSSALEEAQQGDDYESRRDLSHPDYIGSYHTSDAAAGAPVAKGAISGALAYAAMGAPAFPALVAALGPIAAGIGLGGAAMAAGALAAVALHRSVTDPGPRMAIHKNTGPIPGAYGESMDRDKLTTLVAEEVRKILKNK